MDLDSYAAVREPRWDRLQRLASQRRLRGEEADELARLYQLTATDLSAVRSTAPDPVMISRLSTLLANARAALAGAREPVWRDTLDFMLYRVPAALYRLRWLTIGVMAGFLLVGGAVAWHFSANPELLELLGNYEAREELANEQFAYYYEEYPSSSFFASVWTNNTWVAALSVAGGFTGFFTVYIQFQNAVNVGGIAAVMYEFDSLDVFFQLIIPHGLLELTAIWVAGAAGLRLFWALFVPGGRPRLRAMAEEGRVVGAAMLGLVYILMVAGLIEGFVTGSAVLPWVVKDAIGVLALAGFWFYVFWFGKRATMAGYTGDVSRDNREDYAPVAA